MRPNTHYNTDKTVLSQHFPNVCVSDIITEDSVSYTSKLSEGKSSERTESEPETTTNDGATQGDKDKPACAHSNKNAVSIFILEWVGNVPIEKDLQSRCIPAYAVI